MGMWVRSLGEDAAEVETRVGGVRRPGSAAGGGQGRRRTAARAGSARGDRAGGAGFTVWEVGDEMRQWG
jgi:hypothetical protein